MPRDLLDASAQGLDRGTILKELKAIKTALKPEPVAEKFSPSEELEIKRLERAINRRLELATRIG